MINKSKNINELYTQHQSQYLADRSNQTALAAMCDLISYLSKKYIISYCKRTGVTLDAETLQDRVADVLSRVLTRYKTNPTWHIKRLTASLYFDVLKVITQNENNRSIQQKFEDNVSALPDNLAVVKVSKPSINIAQVTDDVDTILSAIKLYLYTHCQTEYTRFLDVLKPNLQRQRLNSNSKDFVTDSIETIIKYIKAHNDDVSVIMRGIK